MSNDRQARPRMAVHRRLDHHVADELLDAGAVDREVGRLAHADVGPGRGLDHAGLIGPVVRILVGDDRHAALLQARYGVRRRHLDPIDLAGEQGGGPGRRFRHREQQHLIELRHARLVPVAVEAAELHTLARHDAIDLKRTSARRIEPYFTVALPSFSHWVGPRIEDVGHVVGKQRVDHARGQFDRVPVDAFSQPASARGRAPGPPAWDRIAATCR